MSLRTVVTLMRFVLAASLLIVFTTAVNAQGNSIDNGAIVDRGEGTINVFTATDAPLRLEYGYEEGPGDLKVDPRGRDLNWFSHTTGPDTDISVLLDIGAPFGYVQIAQGTGHLSLHGECSAASEPGCILGATEFRFLSHGEFEAVGPLGFFVPVVFGSFGCPSTSCDFRLHQVINKGVVKHNLQEATPR